MRLFVLTSIAAFLAPTEARAAYVAALSTSIECSVSEWHLFPYPTDYVRVYSRTVTEPTRVDNSVTARGCDLDAPSQAHSAMADLYYHAEDSWVYASTWAGASPIDLGDGFIEGWASASLSVGFSFYTPSPVRSGSISFSAHSRSLGGGILSVRSSVSGSVDLSGCGHGVQCSFPYTIGTPFRIDLNAWSTSEGEHTVQESAVIISVFEADGHTDVAFLPLPEPAVAWSVISGLLVLAYAGWRKRERISAA